MRRRPARYAALADLTARRVVRSLAVYGCSGSRAPRRSCTMSARTLPPERSTSSSILSRYRSTSIGRRTGACGSAPVSRARTYRATVLGSQAARSAAEWGQRVRSKASRISMISLSDFCTVPPVRAMAWVSEHRKGRPPGDRRAGHWTRATRCAVRRAGDQLSVSEEVRVRLRGGWHVRCQGGRGSSGRRGEGRCHRHCDNDQAGELTAVDAEHSQAQPAAQQTRDQKRVHHGAPLEVASGRAQGEAVGPDQPGAPDAAVPTGVCGA